jgi:hypothetical protein
MDALHMCASTLRATDGTVPSPRVQQTRPLPCHCRCCWLLPPPATLAASSSHRTTKLAAEGGGGAALACTVRSQWLCRCILPVFPCPLLRVRVPPAASAQRPARE